MNTTVSSPDAEPDVAWTSAMPDVLPLVRYVVARPDEFVVVLVGSSEPSVVLKFTVTPLPTGFPNLS